MFTHMNNYNYWAAAIGPLHSLLLHGSNQITSNSNGKSSDSWSTSVHMANSLWHGSQSTPQYPKECAISPTLLVSWACS